MNPVFKSKYMSEIEKHGSGKKRLPVRQAGLALVWVALLSTVILSLAALAIDLARQQIIVRHIQNAADATALAAVNQLDGSIQGWFKAKRSAAAVLSEQRIMGAGAALQQPLEFIIEGEIDLLESSISKYRATVAAAGELRIEVERGIYLAKTGEFEFYTLEGLPLEPVRKPVEGFSEIPFKYNFPVHQLANAVQVKITLQRIPTLLAGFMGTSETGPISRQAVALSNSRLEEVVAPLAIPACSLLLDQDPYESAKYEAGAYNAGAQCQRELLFMEANPTGSDTRDRRLRGMIRAASYPRPPTERFSGGPSLCGADLAGDGPNCKAIPIRGVIGAPNTGLLPSQAEPSEIRALFNQMALTCSGAQDCGVKVKLGQYFKPLHNAIGINGLYVDQVAALEMQLKTLIQNSAVKFAEKLNPYRPGSGFPYLYQPHDSAVVSYGDSIDLQMGNQHRVEEFVNPLCQYAPLNFKTVGSVLQPVPLEQRNIRPLKAMVIAPDEPGSSYCDFDALFNFEPLDSDPPLAETKPLVIGFVDVYLFDFGLRRLQDSSLIGDTNPQRLYTVQMMNPLRTFIDEHSEWLDCVKDKCVGKAPPPNCDEECPRPQGSGTQLISREWWEKTRECYLLPSYDDLHRCLNPPSSLPELLRWLLTHFIPVCLPIWGQQMSGGWGTLTQEAIQQGWKCFPEPIKDCSDPTDWACWRPPQHLEPQFGCGAMRARVDCAGQTLAPSILSQQSRPALVK